MEYKKSKWCGFKMLEFEFDGKGAKLVLPNMPRDDRKWLLKTEYFGAFPNFELVMLERGYYVAHVQNITRWCLPEDTARQAAFCEFLHREFGLAKTCMPVGMSCGGMQAVYLAAKYPHLVASLYLDAPVLNLLSCPCSVGRENGGKEMYEEFVRATGRTVSELINDRNHPIDYVDKLIEYKIPIALICGEKDSAVPYLENGAILAQKYEACNVPFLKILKPDCDHHPHGVDDLSPLLSFANLYL